ncbi:MAG TPA: hypothetical protein VGH91_07100 [Gammaproteobacteria bacterium]|jgi:hypothetical protein
MNAVIAELKVFAKHPGEDPFEITIEVGTPYKFGEDEWVSPVSVSPLLKNAHEVHGNDSLQALSLSLNLVRALLQDIRDKGGSLGFEGNDDGFPLDAYFPGTKWEQKLGDMSSLSDRELDALLLAQCKPRLRKVAMVVALAMRPYENWDEKRISDRIMALADAGDLVSEGDIRKWTYSEIRLPGPQPE